MKWLVAPIVAVLIWIIKRMLNNEKKQNEINTELKVLDAKMEAQAKFSKENHDALRATLGQVLTRLDSIDSYLRSSDNKH